MPRALVIAAGVEALQGLLVIGAGIFVGVEVVLGRASDVPSALALAVTAVVCGAGLGAVARGIWTAQRWSRAPGVLTQIFALIVGYSMLQGDRYVIAAVLAVTGATGLVALFTPQATGAYLEED